MPRLLNNVGHWRERAEEARALASQLSDPETRRIMLGIADGYDRMAEHAEAEAVKPGSATRTRS